MVAETRCPKEFSSKREPTRPCRFCGGAHWDDKCPNTKETTSMKVVAKEVKNNGKCHVCGETGHKVLRLRRNQSLGKQ